eukprot:SAG31_NODE_402_length_16197_cov_5.262425_11_plen_74_part_00
MQAALDKLSQEDGSEEGSPTTRGFDDLAAKATLRLPTDGDAGEASAQEQASQVCFHSARCYSVMHISVLSEYR